MLACSRGARILWKWSRSRSLTIVEFEGEFETHLTIRLEGPTRVDALRAWSEHRGLKFHHIVLDRGLTPSQPMVSRRGRGLLSGERFEAAELSRHLTSDGFSVSRFKIEAAPWNRDVPDSDVDAAGLHPGRYFEHHVKLALDPDVDIPALAALAQGHAARLSRNALRVRDDGRRERFVTQRCHNVGRPTAKGRLNALLAALAEGGYAILKAEEEFVVLDSDPGVDSGWLDPGGA
jgi:hypothetical protein